MPDGDQLAAARAMRRAMLGDAYVDAQLARAADSRTPDPVAAEFQD